MPNDVAAPVMFIGLMSGTSLDGVDGVLASFDEGEATYPARSSHPAHAAQVHCSNHIAFPPALRAELLALQHDGANEIHREARAANQLTRCYADCVAELMKAGRVLPGAISAIGAHGQTIRHRPELGYTRQTNNPALLAELSGIDVIADFRSRDIAAGGQGAPLVPAFHQWLFADPDGARVIANIGGIANLSVLPSRAEVTTATIGFDTGPGNVLLDGWIEYKRGLAYDAAGAWGASGTPCATLLARLRAEPYFALPAPKSTGRDLFNRVWLQRQLAGFADLSDADVQATLTELSATTLADAICAAAPDASAVHVCGGGVFNDFLMQRLQAGLHAGASAARVMSSAALGVAPDQVEALAFAWLAWQFTRRRCASVPSVTGANGPRILGALYPA